MKTVALNTQQIEFCKLYARGLSQRKAYQKAYGYEGKKDEATIKKCSNGGSQLMKKPAIKEKIAELKRLSEERTAQSIIYTKLEHFDKLREIQDKCLEVHNYATALKVEELKGKLMGFYDNKQDDNNGDNKQPIQVLIGRLEKESSKC